MKVRSESEVAQSCPTPSDLMDYSPPDSSVHGIFQARVLEWGAIAFSEDYEQPYRKNKNQMVQKHKNKPNLITNQELKINTK